MGGEPRPNPLVILTKREYRNLRIYLQETRCRSLECAPHDHRMPPSLSHSTDIEAGEADNLRTEHQHSLQGLRKHSPTKYVFNLLLDHT